MKTLAGLSSFECFEVIMTIDNDLQVSFVSVEFEELFILQLGKLLNDKQLNSDDR